MKAGLITLFVSIAYALFLMLRVQSFLGQKFLILSGSNLLNAQGIQLSEGAFYVLWLIALIGIFTGIWLIHQNRQKSGISS